MYFVCFLWKERVCLKCLQGKGRNPVNKQSFISTKPDAELNWFAKTKRGFNCLETRTKR